MADISLPSSGIVFSNVNGTTHVARSLGGTDAHSIITGAGQSIEVCELPIGSVLLSISLRSTVALTGVTLGIEGPSVTDGDMFRASAAVAVGDNVLADIGLPYVVKEKGEKVVLDSATAITAANLGAIVVSYTVDPFFA